jgi:hypothetical protein
MQQLLENYCTFFAKKQHVVKKQQHFFTVDAVYQPVIDLTKHYTQALMFFKMHIQKHH